LPGVALRSLQVYDALLPLRLLVVPIGVDRWGGGAARPFLFPLLVGLYALARFGTEFLRPRGAGETLLPGQWLELGAGLAGVVLLTVGRRAWCRLVQGGTGQDRARIAGPPVE